MAVSTVELAFLFLLLIGVGVAIFFFASSYKYSEYLSGFKNARGLNGPTGKAINLTCPAGKNITIERAYYICSSPDSNGYENTTCDPMANGSSGTVYGHFNPATTYNATSELGSSCNGQNSCVINVNSATAVSKIKGNGSCNCSPGNTFVVGNYTCG
jgi:hypothetical protein